MSRDAWDEFSKTILVRHIISLWNPLFGSFCVVKKIFAFSVGGGGVVFLAFQPINLPEVRADVLSMKGSMHRSSSHR